MHASPARSRALALALLNGLLLIPGLAVSPAAAAEPACKALVGGRLIDGFAHRPLADSVVLIEGELIRTVGTVETLPVPAGCEVISTEGMDVLPGLWESQEPDRPPPRHGDATISRPALLRTAVPWEALHHPLRDGSRACQRSKKTPPAAGVADQTVLVLPMRR